MHHFSGYYGYHYDSRTRTQVITQQEEQSRERLAQGTDPGACQQQGEDVSFCGQCGTKSEPDGVFCGMCGRAL
ncbi:MAG TPA: hypothetical protein VEL31_05720 [Ktedonobacteraceae bacterium]|nr:hypothetical protein [Ktedonobacteraceae bacterium]